MPSETLLLGVAQMAVVIAGFTAVTSVLQPPGGAWSPALRIRHRAIVSTSFNVLFGALVPLIVFARLADVRSSLMSRTTTWAHWPSLPVSSAGPLHTSPLLIEPTTTPLPGTLVANESWVWGPLGRTSAWPWESVPAHEVRYVRASDCEPAYCAR